MTISFNDCGAFESVKTAALDARTYDCLNSE